jgi:hypothetical protein
MTSTQQEAYDEIMGVIADGWAANSTSAAIPLLYDDRRKAKPGEDANGLPLPYARASIANVGTQRQCIAPVGQRQFEEEVIATVEIWTPFNDGRTMSNELVQIAVDFFRAVVSAELEVKVVGPPERLGQEGPYFKVNVPALITYYQIG